MPSARQTFGRLAEDRAAEFLRGKGYRIIGKHYTSRYGEIDILVEDGETIVAVEVKARRSTAFGRAAESVTEEKLARLTKALAVELERRGWQKRPVRIDVIAIDPGQTKGRFTIRHLIGVGG